MPKEQYMCQLCANHGIFNQPKKGHKLKCLYRSCTCNLCALNSKRRALDQMERQLKHENVPPTSYSESAMRHLIPQGAPVSLSPSSSVSSIFPSQAMVIPYCVALPPTVSKKDYHFIPKNQQATRRKEQPKTLDEVLEQIGRRSIFHSAEQLAR